MNLSRLVLVEDRLRGADGTESAEIVAVLLQPDPDSLTRVARLSPGTRLGIVCDLGGTLQTLTGMIAFNPGLRMIGLSFKVDERSVQQLAARITARARPALAAAS